MAKYKPKCFGQFTNDAESVNRGCAQCFSISQCIRKVRSTTKNKEKENERNK